MSENDRELMERYIYQVVRRLPKSQREETAMELRELIDDMSEQDGTTVEDVIEKLGNPAVFARKFQESGNYLIGPKYYEDFLWVLKIVAVCVVASAVVSGIVQGVMERNWLEGIIKGIIENGISSLLFGFGGVTLVFAILERQNVKVDIREEKKWSVESLKKDSTVKNVWTSGQMNPVLNKKAQISRWESAAGVIFMVLFSGLLIFAPHLLGAYVFEGDEFVRTIPILNLDQWSSILPVLLLALFIGFIDEMIRLAAGCYCKGVMVSNIICNILQLGLGVFAVYILPFWNPDFVREVSSAFGKEVTSKGDMFFYYGTDIFTYLIIGIMVVIAMIEVGETIYKTLRYGKDL